jgi:hypothetical protein
MGHDLFYLSLCEERYLGVLKKDIGKQFEIRSVHFFEWTAKDKNIERLNLSTLKYGGFIAETSRINVIIFSINKNKRNIADEMLSKLKKLYNLSVLLTSNKVEYDYISLLFFKNKERVLSQISYKWDQKSKIVKSNLIGSEGWCSFEECFNFINLTNNWVVLRNSEYLPNEFFENDKDVDLLCENIEKFVKSINATKRHDGISCYYVKINNIDVEFDIRYLGDDYYDRAWEVSLLKNKIISHQGVPELKGDEALYSLLYHALIHKQQIKPKYLRLFMNYFNMPVVGDKESLSFLLSKLNNYMEQHGYKVVYPLDSLCLYSFNYDNLDCVTSNNRYRYKLSEIRLDIMKVKVYNFLLEINSNLVSKLLHKKIKKFVLHRLIKND